MISQYDIKTEVPFISKCISCDFESDSTSELSKHYKAFHELYEDNELKADDCEYLKCEKCDFWHTDYVKGCTISKTFSILVLSPNI